MKKYNLFAIALLTAGCLFAFIGCSASRQTQTISKSDLPKISFGYWDIDSLQNTSKSDGITAALEEKFGFSASFQSFDWSTYKMQYQILAATDTLPDVFTNLLLSSNDTNDVALYNQMIEDETIHPLPDDLSDYPHLEKLLSKYEYLRHKDGHMYAIPHPIFTEDILSSSDAAMLVRKDWMTTLGIQAPQNINEFISMVTAFALQDPDGNGKNDTIGYNVNNLPALGKWVMLGIAPECNVYSWIHDTDGLYRPSWMTDAFRNVVTIYRDLYKLGGLDSDFYVKNPSTVVNDFITGKLGAMEYKSSASSLAELRELWNTQNDVPFDACVDVLPTFPAPDGKCYSNSSNSFWSEAYISSNVTDDELHIILSLIDYLLSDEGADLYNYGIQGTDYSIASDHSITSQIADENSSHLIKLAEKYPSIELWANLAHNGWDSSDFESTNETQVLYTQECISLAQKSLTYCKEKTIQVARPYDFLIYPKEHASYSNDAFDAFIQCIIGTEDPLKMWDESLELMKSQGLEEYVIRQNQLYLESQSTNK